MINLVGYRVNYKKPNDYYPPQGGLLYDYLLASNGLFIEAGNKLMVARIPIAPVAVKGLGEKETRFILQHGRIPQRFWDLALSVILAEPEIERYAAITWVDGYHLYVPEQKSEVAEVKYTVGENIVVEMHSHGKLGSFFSAIDDKDEQGLKIYGVVGDLCDDTPPSLNLRLGVYGYWMPVRWEEIFEGQLSGVTDVVKMEQEGEKI
jgi:PRTRC genetic system protein A